MDRAEAADDARLPGGALHDPAPLDRGDGAWLWTTGGAPMSGTEPLRIDGAGCEWYEGGPTRISRGWYVLARLPGDGAQVRVGPYATAFGLADALRDLFPASQGGRDDVEYLEGRVAELIDLAGDERIVEAAQLLATGGRSSLGGGNPAGLIAGVRAACADRDAWERRGE